MVDIDTVKLELHTILKPVLKAIPNVTIKDFYLYRPSIAKLSNSVGISFAGSTPAPGTTGGKRLVYRFVFQFGRLMSNQPRAAEDAEEDLNAIEDAIRDTFLSRQGTSFIKTSWQQSLRPNSPRGLENVRFGEIYINTIMR